MDKPDNSKECACGGYKLSSIIPDVDRSFNLVQVSFGCEDDDSFYQDADNAGRVLVLSELKDGQLVKLDLEDVLRFSRAYCNGIYERIYLDVSPLSE